MDQLCAFEWLRVAGVPRAVIRHARKEAAMGSHAPLAEKIHQEAK